MIFMEAIGYRRRWRQRLFRTGWRLEDHTRFAGACQCLYEGGQSYKTHTKPYKSERGPPRPLSAFRRKQPPPDRRIFIDSTVRGSITASFYSVMGARKERNRPNEINDQHSLQFSNKTFFCLCGRPLDPGQPTMYRSL